MGKHQETWKLSNSQGMRVEGETGTGAQKYNNEAVFRSKNEAGLLKGNCTAIKGAEMIPFWWAEEQKSTIFILPLNIQVPNLLIVQGGERKITPPPDAYQGSVSLSCSSPLEASFPVLYLQGKSS